MQVSTLSGSQALESQVIAVQKISVYRSGALEVCNCWYTCWYFRPIYVYFAADDMAKVKRTAHAVNMPTILAVSIKLVATKRSG